MNWRFWKKEAEGEVSVATKPEKLSGAKEIPSAVGRYLVVNLGKDPDWVWNLKAFLRVRTGGKSSFDVRVFDKAQATSKRVALKDYNSLDGHPELVLYEGWFDKKSNLVELNESITSRAA